MATDREKIASWLAHIGETDPATIAEVMEHCRTDKQARAYYVGRSAEVQQPNPFADRVEKARQGGIIQDSKRKPKELTIPRTEPVVCGKKLASGDI